jgi:hypothetical protein
MKEQSTRLENGIIPLLEKFIKAAVMKLKNVWRQEASHTGIQFYTELDD